MDSKNALTQFKLSILASPKVIPLRRDKLKTIFRSEKSKRILQCLQAKRVDEHLFPKPEKRGIAFGSSVRSRNSEKRQRMQESRGRSVFLGEREKVFKNIQASLIRNKNNQQVLLSVRRCAKLIQSRDHNPKPVDPVSQSQNINKQREDRRFLDRRFIRKINHNRVKSQSFEDKEVLSSKLLRYAPTNSIQEDEANDNRAQFLKYCHYSFYKPSILSQQDQRTGICSSSKDEGWKVQQNPSDIIELL